MSEEVEIQNDSPEKVVKSSSNYSKLSKELEELSSAEEKIQVVVDFMERTLAQKGTPRFKDFWDARQLCLDLFKEQLPPALRSVMWDKYSELSKEARRLKEIFDEKSAFAVEQIEIAISAIEKDLEHYDEALLAIPDIKSPENCRSVKRNFPKYNTKQRELNLLNTFATRVNSLRKELIKTDMRIRQKNKFFQRLSKLGDRIFPQRKELIQEVSQLFVKDVEYFANSAFAEENKPLFAVREEIKGLQQMAKMLTLNTGSFNQTRKYLSESWDKVRELGKERKKVHEEKRGEYQENAKKISEMIQALSQELEESTVSLGQASDRVDGIVRDMREAELGRDEVNQLRDELSDVKRKLREQTQAEEKVRQEQKEEIEKKRFEDVEKIRKAISKLKGEEGLDEIEAMMKSTNLKAKERDEFKQALIPVRDSVRAAKGAELVGAGKHDEALKLLRDRRAEIKKSMEELRKAMGGSGLDFETSLKYTEQVSREKERLESVDAEIRDLEKK